MSVQAAAEKRPSRVGFVLLLICLAACIFAVQIGLPFLSYRLANETERQLNFRDGTPPERFWSQRTRFAWFLDPLSVRAPSDSVVSAAVFNDEIIVLHGEVSRRGSAKQPLTMTRVNLKTSRITSTIPLQSLRHVLSDGESIWWIPEDESENPTSKCEPFVWDGRPVEMTDATSIMRVSQFREFENGKWQQADLVGILPEEFPGIVHFDWQSDGSGKVFCVVSAGRHLWFQSGFELVEKADLNTLKEKYFANEWNRDGPVQDGIWNYVHLDDAGPTGSRFWTNSAEQTYLIYDKAGLSMLVYGDFVDENMRSGFLCYRPFDRNSEVRFVPLPVPWNREPIGIRVVNSSDRHTYLILCGGTYGPWQVYEWNNEQLRPILFRTDPAIWLVCLDGVLFFAAWIALPMWLLGLSATSIQRKVTQPLASTTTTIIRPRLTFSSGHSTVVLASIVQRGIARLIDLIVLFLPLVVLLLRQPGFMQWWLDVAEKVRWITLVVTSPEWNWIYLEELEIALRSLFDVVTMVPVYELLALTAATISLTQLVVQARTGRTIGKWFCRIKVVRTTLRPCGIARSLLRELALVVDSLCLMSWVPGVITMVITTRSQRIGDLLSDTIVVQDDR